MCRVGCHRCLQLLFASGAPFSLQLIGVAVISNESAISGTASFCAAYGCSIYDLGWYLFYLYGKTPDMDDADTLSFTTDDIDRELLLDSPRSAASAVSVQTIEYPGTAEGVEGDAVQPGLDAEEDRTASPSLLYGVALRSDIMRQLQRNPSAALDDGQLAVYLQFRGVTIAAVVEWGIFYYLEQHEQEYDLFRREITQQIQTTVADMDHLRVLAFFRHMLDGEHLEAFYTAVYQLVIDRLNTATRVSYFADVIHPLPTYAEEDAHTPTEPDNDSSSEQSSVRAAGADPATDLVIEVLDDSEHEV